MARNGDGLLGRTVNWLRQLVAHSQRTQPPLIEVTDVGLGAIESPMPPRAEPAPVQHDVESILRSITSYIDQNQLDEGERYVLAESLAGAVYPEYKFSEFSRVWLRDETFFALYRRFMDPGNWHSCDRKFFLSELLKTCERIEGDYAECGVYRGASSVFMCRSARTRGKLVHLFDSWDGLSEPGEHDGSYWTRGGLRSSEAELKSNLSEFDCYRTYPGWIPERFADVGDRRFSFVHVDVDLYQPTLDSISFFYPRLVTGGILLLDDHGFESCLGARRAAVEFFKDRPEPVMDVPTGQGLVVKR